MQIKVLNVCFDDYANFSHNNANALRFVGVKCEDVKMVPHVFGYETQSAVLTNKEIRKKIQAAEIVQIFHTADTILTICNQLKKKRVVVYHTGTRYRQNPQLYNAIFNPHIERGFTDQTEFIGLGIKNETYIATAINTEMVYPTKTIASILNISHFPSNPDVKGTARISADLDLIKEKYKFLNINIDLNRVDQPTQYARMRDCDIYVELWSNKQGGKDYGCYGVTAFEAAAMGKIVITQNLRPEVYKNFYGCSEPFELLTDENTLYKIVDRVCNTDYYVLRDKQAETRKWLSDNHSFIATGNRLKQILNIK